jgi:hypothetical protein
VDITRHVDRPYIDPGILRAYMELQLPHNRQFRHNLAPWLATRTGQLIYLEYMALEDNTLSLQEIRVSLNRLDIMLRPIESSRSFHA